MTDRATPMAQQPGHVLRWETAAGPAVLYCPAGMEVVDIDELAQAITLQISTLRRAAALRALAQEAPGDE